MADDNMQSYNIMGYRQWMSVTEEERIEHTDWSWNVENRQSQSEDEEVIHNLKHKRNTAGRQQNLSPGS